MHPELVSRVSVDGAIYPSLKGKSVLITGGGSGIGASLVEHFCAQGARVGFIELNPDYADETARHIAATTGNEPAYEAVDLRDIGALRSAIGRSRSADRPGPGSRQ